MSIDFNIRMTCTIRGKMQKSIKKKPSIKMASLLGIYARDQIIFY